MAFGHGYQTLRPFGPGRRLKGSAEERKLLAAWPPGAYPGDGKWAELVNRSMREGEEKALRESMGRGRPLGDEKWVARAAAAMGLGHTLRARGRPRKDKRGERGGAE